MEEVTLHPLPLVLPEKGSLSQPGPSALQHSSVMVQIPQGILKNLGGMRNSLKFWPGNMSSPERRSRNPGRSLLWEVMQRAESAEMICVCVEGR